MPRRNEADIDDVPEHLRKRHEVRPGRQRRRGAGCGARTATRAATCGFALKLAQVALLPGADAGYGVQCKRTLGERWHRRKKAAKAGAGAVAAGQAVRYNEYVQRLVEDDELRDEPAHGVSSPRSKAYERMNGKGPVKALDDKKTQKELREAVTSLREAADSLRGKKKARSGVVAACSSSPWSAARLLSPSARACARRFWTRCSGPRRSSSTRRPPRRTDLPAQAHLRASPSAPPDEAGLDQSVREGASCALSFCPNAPPGARRRGWLAS